MNTLKTVVIICAIYILAVFGGTALSMYLDGQFYGTLMRYPEVHAKEKQTGDTQTVIGPNGKKYTVRIVSYIPKIDDEPKLMVIHDKELDMYCYTNQNDPYYIVTGLNCYPGWYIKNEGMK